MKLLIVISDVANRLLIKNHLKSIDGISAVIECNSAEEALFLVLENKPDIIISSDLLPGRSGFDLVNVFNKNNISIPIIILSTCSDKAVDAIKMQVFDFLVYPFNPMKLKTSVENAICEIEESLIHDDSKKPKRSKIKITTHDGFKFVDVDLLTYCEANGSYTNLYFSNGLVEYTSYYLGKLEKVLKEYNFVKINRSVLVSMLKIKSIDIKNRTCIIQMGTLKKEFKITKLYLTRLEEINCI